MNFTTYMHPYVGKGRATLAIVVDGENVKVGMAFCSPKDKFKKARGREIALSRLQSDSEYTFSLKLEANVKIRTQVYNKFLEYCLQGKVTNRKFPLWAHKTIKREVLDQEAMMGLSRMAMSFYDEEE